MRFLRLLAPLLPLTACNSQQPTPSGDDGPALDALPEVNGMSAAELLERARTALAQVLRDPGSAEYSNLRAGSGGSVCGTVTLGRAGPRLFVVTPSGVAMVSTSPRLDAADPLDPFVDSYTRWCATPEEMILIQESIANGAAADPLGPPPAADLLNETAPAPAPEAGPPSGESGSRWRETPGETGDGQARDDGSFMNAVRRSGRDR